MTPSCGWLHRLAPAVTLALVCACNPSTHVTSPITDQPADMRPAWSPDGSLIAYSHFNPGMADTSGLFVADTTGAHRRLLAVGNPRGIDWSPDSRFVVYDDDTGIHVVSRDGGSVQTIYPGGSFPSWSPDGSTIAFDTNRQIWLMSATGTDLRQAADAFPVRMPDWSDDGHRLVVVEYPQSDPGGELAVIDLSDGSTHLITANTNVDQYPRWSPTGDMVTWNHWAKGPSGVNRPEVWVADTNGATAHKLIAAYTQPSWHPGGRAIVFSMQATGGIRLFVINVDGTGLRQITH